MPAPGPKKTPPPPTPAREQGARQEALADTYFACLAAAPSPEVCADDLRALQVALKG